jgi:hypothetical protein
MGKVVEPKTEAKILGVIMDCELRFKVHIVKTATRSAATPAIFKQK